MSLILSGSDGLSDVDGTAAAPAIRGTDTDTGIFFGTDIIGFSEGGVESARFNADAQFVAAAGTAALPVITTTGDVNTGIFFPAADTIAFAEGGAEAMRIDSSGNFMVGTTSAILSGKITTSFAGNAINGMTFNDSTSATGAAFCLFSISGSAIGNISRVGATSAVAYNTTSDKRLKSNITDCESVIEKLMTVKVRQYDWTEGQVHQDYGFIAQELEPVLSGVVTKGKTDEDVWQLDYSKLTPHLLKAIQEQQALITALTTRITALEAA